MNTCTWNIRLCNPILDEFIIDIEGKINMLSDEQGAWMDSTDRLE